MDKRSPAIYLFVKWHQRESKNKKQESRNKRFSTFAVSRLRHSETKKKHCLIRESSFQRNMCETANQQSISSHMVVYMACKMRCRWLTFRRCFVNRALSRNRSLRDAKPARYLFVWFVKTLFSGTLFIVSGWRRRVWKTVLFRVSHLFSVFWLSFVAALILHRFSYVHLNQEKTNLHTHLFN